MIGEQIERVIDAGKQHAEPDGDVPGQRRVGRAVPDGVRLVR